MKKQTVYALGMAVLLGLVTTLAACERADEEEPAGEMPTDMPMGDMPMADEPMAGMPMDPAMMARHADEAEAMAAEVREHVGEMRGLAAEQQHERMGEHVRRISAMLGLVDRQMREMSMGMPVDDEQMGAMMGMTAGEHRGMMEEMRALRAELEGLQTAPVPEVRERMGAHLDRCERMVEMLEESAAHMRGVGSGR